MDSSSEDFDDLCIDQDLDDLDNIPEEGQKKPHFLDYDAIPPPGLEEAPAATAAAQQSSCDGARGGLYPGESVKIDKKYERDGEISDYELAACESMRLHRKGKSDATAGSESEMQQQQHTGTRRKKSLSAGGEREHHSLGREMNHLNRVTEFEHLKYERKHSLDRERGRRTKENFMVSSFLEHRDTPSTSGHVYRGTWPADRPSDVRTALNTSLPAGGVSDLGPKVECVYSLLPMLGSHDAVEMSSKFLELSRSPETCATLRRSGCIPLLVQMIHSDSDEVARRMPAWRSTMLFCVIRTTRRDGVAAPSEAVADDTERHPSQAISSLMKISFDEEHRHAMCQLGALQTIAISCISIMQLMGQISGSTVHFTSSCHKAEFCAVDGALAFLVDMLTFEAPSKTLTIVENAGGILRNVSSHIAVREDYRKILRQRDCLGILLQQLKSESLTVVSNACGTLWNLSARCQEDQKYLWDNQAVPMLRSLIHSKHKMISNGSNAALKNLLNFRPGVVNQIGMDSITKSMNLKELPTLNVRKQRALEQELDQNLEETWILSRGYDQTQGKRTPWQHLQSSQKELPFTEVGKKPIPAARKPEPTPRRNVAQPQPIGKAVEASAGASFGDYQETDLDQITDYSLRYAENQSDAEEKAPSSVAGSYGNEIILILDDSVKCYQTEGTPYAISNAASMSDLRRNPKDDVPTKSATVFSSGIHTPEKPVNYCEEGTPGALAGNSVITGGGKVKEPNVGDVAESGANSAGAAGSGNTPKAVTFVDNAQETPLMFSRTSSIESLSSVEPNIGDDRSSVVECVYSLLSMLGSHDAVEMSSKFLELSRSPETCATLRRSGCIPLLVQMIHSDSDEVARKNASMALHNVVLCHPDDKAGRREVKVLRLIEHVMEYCNFLKALKQPPPSEAVADDTERHPSQAISSLMKISFDEEHRHAMCQLGALQTIANLVHLDHAAHGAKSADQRCISLRRYAGMALTNLTFGDGNNKALLCSNKDFMRALVAQLDSSADDLLQVTASVLRNLSWRADANMISVLNEIGTVTALTRAAMRNKMENTLKAILSALWNLSAHCSANKAEFCAVDGALAFLVDMLTFEAPSKTLTIVENAGGILRNVSSHIAVREDYRKILRQRDCLGILLQQLKSESLTVVSNACGTLWNLSARCQEDQKYLWDNQAVPMLRSLIHSKHKMISNGSNAALKNLLNFRPGVVNQIGMDSITKSMNLKELPTLNVRKQRALEQELDQNLEETCENLDVTTPPKEEKTVQDFANIDLIHQRDFVQRIRSDAGKEDAVATPPIIPKRTSLTEVGKKPIPAARKPEPTPRRNVAQPQPIGKAVEASAGASFGDYQETDLDQITDYSLRYAENQSDAEEKAPSSVAGSYGNEIILILDDSVKCYQTEGTPYAISNAASMSDLRRNPKDDVPTKSATVFSSGIHTPEKPVNYCEEGTPGCFSREFSHHGSLSSLEGGSPPASASRGEPQLKDDRGGGKVKERDVGDVAESGANSAGATGSGNTPKAVTFVDNAQETPLIRLASGIISPSELPDSPTQSIPQSPRRTHQDATAALPQAAASTTPRLRSVFEDETNAFGIENTPAQFSCATSLSNLSLDDEPKIVTDCLTKEMRLINHPSEEQEDEEGGDQAEAAGGLLSSNGENPNNSETSFREELGASDGEDAANDEILLASCINMGMNRKAPEGETSAGSKVTPPEARNTDTVKQYCTEDTPAFLSKAASNSDLSVLSLDTNRCEAVASDSSSDGGCENLLQECIRDGMGAAAASMPLCKENPIEMLRSGSILPPYLPVRDEIQQFAPPVEGTPCNFSIVSGLSDITDPNVNQAQQQQQPSGEDSLSSISVDSEDDTNLLSQAIAAGSNPSRPTTSATKGTTTGSVFTIQTALISNNIPLTLEATNDSYSSIESCESTDNHAQLLEQCIRTGMGQDVNRNPSGNRAKVAQGSSTSMPASPKKSQLPQLKTNQSRYDRHKERERKDEQLLKECISIGMGKEAAVATTVKRAVRVRCSSNSTRGTRRKKSLSAGGEREHHSLGREMNHLNRVTEFEHLKYERKHSLDRERGRRTKENFMVSSFLEHRDTPSTSGHVYRGTWPADRPSDVRTALNTSLPAGGVSDLGPKVECVYSLLSMLGSHDAVEMSSKFLELSRSPETCATLRRSGCIPLLVQMIHSDSDELHIEDIEDSLHESSFDMEISNEFLMENIIDVNTPTTTTSAAAAPAPKVDKHKDPDLMLKSVDRLTQVLVAQAEFLRSSNHADDPSTYEKKSSSTTNTWNEDTCPNDVSFPTLSMTAPMIGSMDDDTTFSDLSRGKNALPLEEEATPTNERREFTETCKFTAAPLSNGCEELRTILTNADLEKTLRYDYNESEGFVSQPDSMDTDTETVVNSLENGINFQVGGEVVSAIAHDPVHFITSSSSSAGPMSFDPSSSMTNSTIIALEAKKIVSELQAYNAMTESATSFDLENVRPPSGMDSLSAMSGCYDVPQSPNLSARARKRSLPPGLLARRALGGHIMTNGSLESINSACNLDSVAPPSGMDELLDSMISVASITSEVAPLGDAVTYSNYETAASEMDDTLMSTWQEVSSDATPIPSDFSSAESTPKKGKNGRKLLTPKQRRKVRSDRYRTYVISADGQTSQATDVESIDDDAGEEMLEGEGDEGSPSKRLLRKQRREEDRSRFKTHTLDSPTIPQLLHQVNGGEFEGSNALKGANGHPEGLQGEESNDDGDDLSSIRALTARFKHLCDLKAPESHQIPTDLSSLDYEQNSGTESCDQNARTDSNESLIKGGKARIVVRATSTERSEDSAEGQEGRAVRGRKKAPYVSPYRRSVVSSSKSSSQSASPTKSVSPASGKAAPPAQSTSRTNLATKAAQDVKKVKMQPNSSKTATSKDQGIVAKTSNFIQKANLTNKINSIKSGLVRPGFTNKANVIEKNIINKFKSSTPSGKQSKEVAATTASSSPPPRALERQSTFTKDEPSSPNVPIVTTSDPGSPYVEMESRGDQRGQRKNPQQLTPRAQRRSKLTDTNGSDVFTFDHHHRDNPLERSNEYPAQKLHIEDIEDSLHESSFDMEISNEFLMENIIDVTPTTTSAAAAPAPPKVDKHKDPDLMLKSVDRLTQVLVAQAEFLRSSNHADDPSTYEKKSSSTTNTWNEDTCPNDVSFPTLSMTAPMIGSIDDDTTFSDLSRGKNTLPLEEEATPTNERREFTETCKFTSAPLSNGCEELRTILTNADLEKTLRYDYNESEGFVSQPDSMDTDTETVVNSLENGINFQVGGEVVSAIAHDAAHFITSSSSSAGPMSFDPSSSMTNSTIIALEAKKIVSELQAYNAMTESATSFDLENVRPPSGMDSLSAMSGCYDVPQSPNLSARARKRSLPPGFGLKPSNGIKTNPAASRATSSTGVEAKRRAFGVYKSPSVPTVGAAKKEGLKGTPTPKKDIGSRIAGLWKKNRKQSKEVAATTASSSPPPRALERQSTFTKDEPSSPNVPIVTTSDPGSPCRPSKLPAKTSFISKLRTPLQKSATVDLKPSNGIKTNPAASRATSSTGVEAKRRAFGVYKSPSVPTVGAAKKEGVKGTPTPKKDIGSRIAGLWKKNNDDQKKTPKVSPKAPVARESAPTQVTSSSTPSKLKLVRSSTFESSPSSTIERFTQISAGIRNSTGKAQTSRIGVMKSPSSSAIKNISDTDGVVRHDDQKKTPKVSPKAPAARESAPTQVTSSSIPSKLKLVRSSTFESSPSSTIERFTQISAGIRNSTGKAQTSRIGVMKSPSSSAIKNISDTDGVVRRQKAPANGDGDATKRISRLGSFINVDGDCQVVG
uniref:Protein zer-1 homolog-like C-terminal domain-containing protein n=1 Tax=Lutzomyia longipalpis TaxID=7200 RepID=A0A1B0CED7_LUTLO